MSTLIIIGGGPGGYRAAAYAVQKGLQVTLFESEELGGTCLNCGCIPTKALCHDAELASLGVRVDFGEALIRKQQVVEQLRGGVEALMNQPGITLVRAHASFKDGHTVLADGVEYKADAIIIATGSAAKLPPIQGIDSPAVVTSTELLNYPADKVLPKRICIIGAGVIGLEFASIFAAFGTEVVVLEFLKECLPAMDGDIAKRLRKQLERRGVTFCMQAAVEAIENKAEGGAVVHFQRKGKEESVDADLVLVATGRRPRTEGMNLEAAGIATDARGFIKVDSQTMQVEGCPSIYAIGDVNGRQLLAHAATYQGLRAVNHLLNHTDGIRLDIMPAAVFTMPEVAGVGPTEEQLKDEGRTYICHKGFYRANGKAVALGETDGIVKLLTSEDDRIIACHILGPHAADMVQEVSALMARDATLCQLRETVHIHPTLSEILTEVS